MYFELRICTWIFNFKPEFSVTFFLYFFFLFFTPNRLILQTTFFCFLCRLCSRPINFQGFMLLSRLFLHCMHKVGNRKAQDLNAFAYKEILEVTLMKTILNVNNVLIW